MRIRRGLMRLEVGRFVVFNLCLAIYVPQLRELLPIISAVLFVHIEVGVVVVFILIQR